jgi:hypothetical protein
MPKFTTDVGGVDTRFSSPVVTEPVDTTTAKAIEQIGNIGIETFKAAKLGQFDAQLEKEQAAFLEEEGAFTPDQLSTVKDFKKRFDVLTQQAKSSGRTDQFRLRAEALLKENIASVPGLADEFRRVASGSLGFDPTGEGLRQRFQEIEENSIDAKRVLRDMEQRAVNMYGMTEGDMAHEQGQLEFQYKEAVRKRIAENDMLSKLRKSDPDLVKLNPAKEALRMSGEYRIDSTGRAATIANRGLAAIGIPESTIKGGLSIEQILKLRPEEREAIQRELADARKVRRDSILHYRADMDEGEYGLFEEQVLGPYDEWAAVLSGEVAMAEVKTSDNLVLTAHQSNLQGSRGYQQLQLMTKVMGINLTDAALANLGNNVINLAEITLGNRPSMPGDEEKTPPDAIKKMGTILFNGIDVAFKEGGTIEQKDKVAQGMLNMANMFSSGVDYKQSTVDAFMNLVKDPSNVPKIKEVISYAPEVEDSINSAAVKHAVKAAIPLNTAITELQRTANKTTPDTDTPVLVVPSISPSGNVTLRVRGVVPPTTFLGGVHPSQGEMQRLNRQVNRLNSTYVRSINNSLQAVHNLSGVSKEEILRRSLEGTELLEQLVLKEEGSEE